MYSPHCAVCHVVWVYIPFMWPCLAGDAAVAVAVATPNDDLFYTRTHTYTRALLPRTSDTCDLMRNSCLCASHFLVFIIISHSSRSLPVAPSHSLLVSDQLSISMHFISLPLSLSLHFFICDSLPIKRSNKMKSDFVANIFHRTVPRCEMWSLHLHNAHFRIVRCHDFWTAAECIVSADRTLKQSRNHCVDIESLKSINWWQPARYWLRWLRIESK